MMATKWAQNGKDGMGGFGIALVLLFLAQGIFIFNPGDNISLALAQAPQTEAETASGPARHTGISIRPFTSGAC